MFASIVLGETFPVGSTARRHIPVGEYSLGSVNNSWGRRIKIRLKWNTLASCLKNDKHSPPVHIGTRREASGACEK